MNKTRGPVLTVGHSNHEPKAFLSLLRTHGVDAVVDVRSAPYSRYLPHFNRELLAETLKEGGIRYAFQGKELGGQPADRAFYDADGHVMYDTLAETPAFKQGIESILDAVSVCSATGSERTDTSSVGRLALMCSEKEPLDCHRTLLVGKTLTRRGIGVAHIHADGSLETHDDAMNRLLDSYKLPYNGDLFRSREEVLDDAVARQARRVGARWRDASGGAARERAL